MLFIKNHCANCSVCRKKRQFDSGLQHEHSAKCFGLVRHGFHQPIMKRTDYRPHKNNACRVRRKTKRLKNCRKKYLRNQNCHNQHDCGDKKKSYLLFCHHSIENINAQK